MTIVSVKGQVVIPKRVREAMGLRPGSRLRVETRGETIVLTPASRDMGRLLFGKHRGLNLLADITAEHRREIEKERHADKSSRP